MREEEIITDRFSVPAGSLLSLPGAENIEIRGLAQRGDDLLATLADGADLRVVPHPELSLWIPPGESLPEHRRLQWWVGDRRQRAQAAAVRRWVAERGWRLSPGGRSALVNQSMNPPSGILVMPSIDHAHALFRSDEGRRERAVLSQPYARPDVVPTVGTNLGPAPYGFGTVAILITADEWVAHVARGRASVRS